MSDALLERGLDELVPMPEELGNWNDVLERAGVGAVNGGRLRRRPRRRTVVTALAVVIFLVAPAVALIAAVATRTYVPFSHAKLAASKVIKKNFADLAPPHLGGASLAAGAREVGAFRVNGRLMRLWVAPRRDGGFCFAIYHAGASCVPPDFTPLWVNQRGFTRSGIALEFAGTITDPRATTIEANYKDGSHDDVPFIYVSPPINAGFFIFGVPNEHLSHESELVAVTALDQNGHVLAREPITFH